MSEAKGMVTRSERAEQGTIETVIVAFGDHAVRRRPEAPRM